MSWPGFNVSGKRTLRYLCTRMNLDQLKEAYIRNSRSLQLAEGILLPHPQQIAIGPLRGGSKSLTVGGVIENENCRELNHLIILDDAESAAYFHNTLEQLVSSLDLFYFPASAKNSKNFQLLSSSHVMLRTEALTKIASGGNKKIVVTYPEAIFEKVVVPKALAGNIIHIRQNENLQTESIMELLVMLGFTHTDFVYEPGQFALRGGIFDIFSYGNEKPYRIELFGNEVDSIRIFDPETQLSERKLLSVKIIPNVETQFDSTEKIPLIDFLPENTVVWYNGWEFIAGKMEQASEQLDIFIDYLRENPHLKAEQDDDEIRPMIKEKITRDDFVMAGYWAEKLSGFHQVSFENDFPENSGKATISIAAKTIPQPSFNRNFQMLISNLKDWQFKDFSIFLCSEQARQLERLYSIFEDLQAAIRFTPAMINLHEGFVDEDLEIVCYTDHQIFQRYHKYKIKQAFSKSKALTLKTLQELQPGDYVTHIDHGVGIFSGLQKIEVGGKMQEAVRLRYKDGDLLYVNLSSLHKISKYTGKEGHVPKMNKLGSDAWNRLKEKTTKQIKDIAEDLIKLYATRKAQKGFAHSPDNYLQTELEASFIYEDTPDQAKASADVKADMQKESPMDRLVCGDVGFGKTEVAIRAAFKTALDGKQAAILVPTTILAYQHYKTFSDRLSEFPVTVDYLNRFRSAREKKEILEKLKEGKIEIIIGTHALLGKQVRFKDLGLMVIDEEQKFGVAAKEKLKQLRTTVDSLTLTATPIPRTLQFSLMGARDLSIINTPPANRQPVHTEVMVFNEDQIRDAIYFETERGGQVFFIHNRVASLPEMAAHIQSLCPDLQIAYAHGQMDGDVLEDTIYDFMQHRYDVLVCTNIVESGVDIPNVNTIFVNNAHQFGLSDLHQLRGRVGRSNKKAFCYLVAPPLSTLPNDSKKRLQTLEQFTDLGSGFQIAMRDLDIRGAGNILGGEQSGFIAEVGFEMYQKILDEAIRELKRSQFKELFQEEISRQDDYVSDCSIETDLEILIPDDYVSNIAERLALYTRLDNAGDDAELELFRKELQDRFGPLPGPVEDLIRTVQVRRLAVDLGFEHLILKAGVLRCYFVANHESPYFQSEVFQRILEFISTKTMKARLKQSGRNGILVVKDMQNMQAVRDFVASMWRFAIRQPEASAAPHQTV